MNTVNLTGRITKDLETKYTNNNKTVCEFSLAVNRVGQEQTDFINCQIWGTQAENLSKYQGKGSLVGIVGSLRVDAYKDKDNNNRYKTYVLVNNVEYLEAKKETSAEKKIDYTKYDENPRTGDLEPIEEDPFATFGQEVSIDDNFLDD